MTRNRFTDDTTTVIPSDHPGVSSRRMVVMGLGGAGLAGAGLFASAAPAHAAPIASTGPRSYFDIVDYGAVGDGVADDRAAIQAAIDAASKYARGLPQGGGAVVYVPSGLYKVSDTLRIGPSNVGMQGVGVGSMIQGTAVDGDIIFAGTKDVSKGEIRNVFFEHFAITSAVVKKSGAAIHCQFAVRFRIEDVQAAPAEVGPGGLYDGLVFEHFDNVAVTRVQIWAQRKGITAWGRKDQGYGANLWIGGGSRIASNNTPGSIGVHIGGSSGGVVIEDTDVVVNETNVLIDDTLSGTCNREICLNQCFIDSASGTGLEVGPNGVNLLHLNNTWISASGRNVLGNGPDTKGFPDGNNFVYRGDTDNSGLNTILVDGCRIFNAFGSGIAAYAGKWLITGSNILYNGQGERGGHGIGFLTDKVAEFVINGCIVSNNGGSDPARPLGPGIEVAAGVDNYIITSNIVRDNATGNIVEHITEKAGKAKLQRIVKDNLPITD